MAERTHKECDLCGRANVYLPDGVQRVNVQRGLDPHLIEDDDGKRNEFSEIKADALDACSRCLERLDKFIFDRGLMTPYRKAALETQKETRKDADSNSKA